MKEHKDDPPCCGHRAECWKPAHHERYCVILGNGTIQSFRWHRTDFDQEAWKFGNCFRTWRETEHTREQITEVLPDFSVTLSEVPMTQGNRTSAMKVFEI